MLTVKPLLAKMNSISLQALKKNKLDVLILFLYLLISFLAYWPIILGTDIMKADIWNAHYPFQVMVSDAINAFGTYPLWNPLVRFGIPYYAFVGTPVWYPLTLLLNAIGYTPFMPGIEYSLHCAIASFGMFLLAKDLLIYGDRADQTAAGYKKLVGPLMAGLFYGYSGLFLSNAEHIMIIISASWVPYILLFSRRFINNKSLLTCMTTGILAGFVLTGGYPELFFDTFIVLCLMNIYWSHEKEPFAKPLTAAVKGIFSTFKIGIATLLASAITIVPFLKIMSLITRSGGQSPVGYPVTAILSAIFPVTVDKLSGMEISMGLFYIGFLPVLLLPAIIWYQKKNYLFYGIMSFISLMMCFGQHEFLHTLFYRFLPMYSTFRFPTLWRVFFAIFALLLVSQFICEIITGTAAETIRFFVKFLGAVAAVGVVLSVIFYAVSITDPKKLANLTLINRSLLLLLLFVVLYLAAFVLLLNKTVSPGIFSLLLILIAAAEVLQVSYKAFPVTIAAYDHEAYFRDAKVKSYIDKTWDAFKSRVNTDNFAGHLRATSGNINTQNISNNKYFDEVGYISVLLGNTVRYSWSYNRTINQNLPEVYFTDNIVDSSRINLETWLNKAGAVPYQVHADGLGQSKGPIIRQSDVGSMTAEKPLKYSASGSVYEVKGKFTSSYNSRVTKIRAYFRDYHENDVDLRLTFTDAKGRQDNYSDKFKVYNDGHGNLYSEISFPVSIYSISANVGARYFSSFRIYSRAPIMKLTAAEYVQGGQDKYAVLEYCGYNSMSINVNAPANGLVTVMQNNYDGWKAYIDGNMTPITEVNGVFIGIPVSKGAHRIELKFRPWDFYAGAAVSIAYFWIYFLVFVLSCRKKRKLAA